MSDTSIKWKNSSEIIRQENDATLWDMRGGVACLELHSQTTALSDNILMMIDIAKDEVDSNFLGLVLTSAGKNFCVGGDLNHMLRLAREKKYDEIENGLITYQNTFMKLKYSDKPIVAAPFSMTLGGGCELCMHASRVQALNDLCIGLVETSVGLIPGCGGTKELLFHYVYNSNENDVRLEQNVKKAFDVITKAKLAKNSKEAKQLGFLKNDDGISVDKTQQLNDAKCMVLKLVESDFKPPAHATVKALGESGALSLIADIVDMTEAGLLSEYDLHVAKKVAYIMTGGNANSGTEVGEDNLLSLEREVFLSLLSEPKTQERMEYMLRNGRPLKN